MNKNDFDQTDKVIKYLQKKRHTITSDDGLVTLVFSGTGDILSFSINKDLSEISDGREVLEEDIVSVFTSSKSQSFLDFGDVISSLTSDDGQDGENEDDDEEDGGGDVS